MSEPAYPLVDDGARWPAQGEWTYEDYLRLPDDGRRYEVIRGHLYVAPAPVFDHQYAIWQLGRLVGNFVVEKGLGILLPAPFDLRLPRGLGAPVQPDLVFLRTGNQPRSGDRGFEGVPDLVVEVLSPGTRHLDRGVKLSAYREAGVPELWLVDPRTRTVQVLVLDGDEYVQRELRGPGEALASPALPGLRLDVSAIFPGQDAAEAART